MSRANSPTVMDLETTVLALQRRHPDVDPAELRSQVLEEFAQYGDAPVQDFVPVLASRHIDARLRRMRR